MEVSCNCKVEDVLLAGEGGKVESEGVSGAIACCGTSCIVLSFSVRSVGYVAVFMEGV
jgi:hypothetical protein